MPSLPAWQLLSTQNITVLFLVPATQPRWCDTSLTQKMHIYPWKDKPLTGHQLSGSRQVTPTCLFLTISASCVDGRRAGRRCQMKRDGKLAENAEMAREAEEVDGRYTWPAATHEGM